MKIHKNNDISLTVQIPERVYETFREYQERFTPHISIDALIVESIIEEVRQAGPGSGSAMTGIRGY
jgi:hypothetical protein